MANKYFGDENPMGKVIMADNQYPMTVSGVMKKIPMNSSQRFDFLVPFDFTKTIGMYQESWFSNNIQTFVMLNKNSDPGPVDRKLTDEVKAHLPPERPASEYQTTLGPGIFTIPAISILVVAIATVCFQAWKASRTSPAVCLKYE